VDEFGVEAVGVVGKARHLPDIDRILASHALLHAAEGALYEKALLDAASEAGLAAHRGDPDTLEVSGALGELRAALGPPWQRDHQLAAAAAFAALRAT
jgi:hypothetical protein